jgi:uncharacterized protein with gpF-like domain
MELLHAVKEMNEMKEGIKEDKNANIKAERKDLNEMMNANHAKGEANLKKLQGSIKIRQAKTYVNLKEMREEIKSGQEETMSIINDWIEDMKDDRRETMSCQVTTQAYLDIKEVNPEDMKSEVEYREIPTEEAAVKYSGTMKKRHRHLAAVL